MPYAVVTGAGGGIGNAFVEVLMGEGYIVYALDRHGSPSLWTLPARNHVVDTTSERSVREFADALGPERPLNLLLHAASIAAPNDSLGTADESTFRRTFALNSAGPFLLTRALIPNLDIATHEAAECVYPDAETPKVCIVSSPVGGVRDHGGGSYAYWASKAALNSIGRSLAIDLQSHSVTVLMLDPGCLRNSENEGLIRAGDEYRYPAWQVPQEPREVARRLWRNVVSIKGWKPPGSFWDRDGAQLPW